MYDRILTDLNLGLDCFKPYSEHVFHWQSELGKTPDIRCLVVSSHAEVLAEAERRGMGFLSHDASLSSEDLSSLLAWVDQKPPANCKLYMFDLGNVVIKNITMLGKIARTWNLDREEFFSDYRKYDFPLMDGTVPTGQYWDHIHRLFGVRVEGEPFAEAFEPILNDEVVSLINELRNQGKRVVCASNTFGPHWEKMGRMGILDLFDRAYASHVLGCSKPSRTFYESILEAEGVSAAQAFFVDDYEQNVEASRKLGLSTLLYCNGMKKTASERLAWAFGR